MVKGVGSIRLDPLLDFWQVIGGLGCADGRALAAGLSEKILDHFRMIRNQVDLDRISTKSSKSTSGITWQDENYPRRLMEVSSRRPVIYVRGSLKPNDGQRIGRGTTEAQIRGSAATTQRITSQRRTAMPWRTKLRWT